MHQQGPGAHLQADRAVEWTLRTEGAGAVHRSTAPLLSAEECAWAIDATEAHAASNGGWTTARHVQAPTTDVPVSQVPELRAWFDGVLKESLFPAVAALYPEAVGSPANLRVMDAFVVRYDAAGQASLPVHQDENAISATIALNGPAEYEGGGVRFETVRPVGAAPSESFGAAVLNADAGGIVTFPGKLRHGGNTITSGRRYVVSLLLLYAGCSPVPPGCSPVPPGSNPEPPDSNPVPLGSNPVPPGSNPEPPGISCRSSSTSTATTRARSRATCSARSASPRRTRARRQRSLGLRAAP